MQGQFIRLVKIWITEATGLGFSVSVDPLMLLNSTSKMKHNSSTDLTLIGEQPLESRCLWSLGGPVGKAEVGKDLFPPLNNQFRSHHSNHSLIF